MKLLIDACLSHLVAEQLGAHGHDTEWVGDWPGVAPDDAILAVASGTGRTVVTLDKDFGELAVHRGYTHVGIVRLAGLSLRFQASACQAALAHYGAELARGAIVTVEPGRVRIRSPAPSLL